MTTFRVFFVDGGTVDVDALTPVEARKVAAGIREGFIAKVKVLKEKANA